MPLQGHILLVESIDGSSHTLATRIMSLGIEPIVVTDLEQAAETLAVGRLSITAVLVPTDRPLGNLKSEIKRVRKAGPASGLIFVSVGKPPARDERQTLRSAGMDLALWEPYDDGTLRFQINRAMGGDRDVHGRSSPRAPTYLLARIFVGDRTKDAVVYSLSQNGAFLETPRASMEGAKLDLEIRLPANPISLRADVIFSNVPGNLQRPNLPLGMGVTWPEIGEADRRALAAYVEQRLSELNV